jgi:hypothetical protein
MRVGSQEVPGPFHLAYCFFDLGRYTAGEAVASIRSHLETMHDVFPDAPEDELIPSSLVSLPDREEAAAA